MPTNGHHQGQWNYAKKKIDARNQGEEQALEKADLYIENRKVELEIEKD